MLQHITGAIALFSLMSATQAQTMDHAMADPHAHHKMDAAMDGCKHHWYMMQDGRIGVTGNRIMPEGKLMVRYT